KESYAKPGRLEKASIAADVRASSLASLDFIDRPGGREACAGRARHGPGGWPSRPRAERGNRPEQSFFDFSALRGSDSPGKRAWKGGRRSRRPIAEPLGPITPRTINRGH